MMMDFLIKENKEKDNSRRATDDFHEWGVIKSESKLLVVMIFGKMDSKFLFFKGTRQECENFVNREKETK